jgi:hypothetical protein
MRTHESPQTSPARSAAALARRPDARTLASKIGNRAMGRLLARQPTSSDPIKTVSVDLAKLRGASRPRGEDIKRANAIFAPARVRFRLHRVDPTNAESDSWIGTDQDIVTSPSCTPTSEESAAYTGAGSAYSLTGRIRGFYVKSISGASFDAYSYHAGCSSSTNEMLVVANNAGGRELAHEFGHILLNDGNGAHSSDANNLMADPDPGTRLTPTQRTTIYANA